MSSVASPSSDPETSGGLWRRASLHRSGPGGTVALARLAALIAVGGAGPSYGLEVTAAIGAGATVEGPRRARAR